jgi:hypothetical protein
VTSGPVTGALLTCYPGLMDEKYPCQMHGAGSPEIQPRPRFPALDPEPPRSPWRILRRVAIPVVVLLAVGLGYTLRSQPGPDPKSRAAAAAAGVRPGQPGAPALSGIVLAVTPAGYLTETDLATGKVEVLRKLGLFDTTPPPVVSPDGKYLVDADTGKLVSLDSPLGPSSAPNKLLFQPGNQPAFLLDPWSDHDASVGILQYSSVYNSESSVQIQSVRTGAAYNLGSLDNAAGDPQRTGAFVTLPADSPPSEEGIQADASLVLRDAGRPRRLLATAAALGHDIGMVKSTPLTLLPVPNPQGTMVAVQVGSMTSNGPGGIVVLSRTGRVLGVQPATPGGMWSLSWSAAGRTLAYLGQGATGTEITRWEVGQQTMTTDLNASGAVSGCLWSPEGQSLLCGGNRLTWIVSPPSTQTPTTILKGDGQALAWLGGRLR